MHCIKKFKNNNCTALIQHTLNRYKIISECIVTTTSTTSSSNCIYFNNKFNNCAANLPARLINVSMGNNTIQHRLSQGLTKE